jgi:hypothetical protein
MCPMTLYEDAIIHTRPTHLPGCPVNAGQTVLTVPAIPPSEDSIRAVSY